MKAAIENGYKIPDDFIIAGYDNLSFCETFTPELTSIATDFHELGKKINSYYRKYDSRQQR
jgi:DNA-binding LacI/PurR family transcriptional regulator